ncbi:MAG: MBL fold metallo-hydrolase [Thermodesulfobacteriota bacterium]
MKFVPSPLQIGDFRLFWLDGGIFDLDAGTMFGVVPRVLWEKKYPGRADGHLTLVNALLLIIAGNDRIVIDTGLGNKLSAKQKKIFRVTGDWRVDEDLAGLGLRRDDITHVLLTHLDFDHAGGITRHGGDGGLELSFPHARHYVQAGEWRDAIQPNLRSKSTYWPENFAGLRPGDNLCLLEGDSDIVTGVRAVHTGGHTRGHQAFRLASAGQSALHLGDLLPNHAHFNPLWVTAFDNFPLDSVEEKVRLIDEGRRKNSWFTFYHDPYMQACRLDGEGGIREAWRNGFLAADELQELLGGNPGADVAALQ